jgi:hypothetical protein
VQASTTRKIQLVLVVAMLIAAIRVGWIFYERHEAAKEPAKKEAAPLNPDYYVMPKKLYPYDLKSARQQLTVQPAWVKMGYYYPYYPYDSASHRADMTHEAGKLLPLQKLDIKDAFMQPAPGGESRIMAVFMDGGKKYATAVGNAKNGEFRFFCNDMLFFEDPHQLYKHWSPDLWQAIDQHQVKPGMSEMQADFAIGVGLMQQGGDEHDRTLHHPNGGKPVDITYHNGTAVAVVPAKNE